MEQKSDVQLLRDYNAGKSEAAFAELVRRHADLVYSAALRQTGAAQTADEVAQTVFIDLARKAQPLAAKMRPDASLTGWLYRATRFAALSITREERRRRAYETQVMQEPHSEPEPVPDWTVVAPLLDDAFLTLDDQERDALLLRFFKKQDFRSVGAALGVTDDTAQKRVARSLDKLRMALLRRGVTTTTAALSTALATQAVLPAPAGLAATWISASVAGAAAAEGSVAFTFLKLMSMTKLQFSVGAILVCGLAATVVVQQRNANKMIEENHSLQQQVAGLAAANDSLSNNLQAASLTATSPSDLERELVRLRGQVGLLREKTNLLGIAARNNRPVQVQKAEKDADASQSPEVTAYLEHRQNVVNAAKQIAMAYSSYVGANNYQTPTNLADIHNELQDTTNFAGDIPLSNFELVNVGKVAFNIPQAAWAREQTPQQSPLGGWDRTYLRADGSVLTAHSSSGTFDHWEQDNYINSFPAPQQ